MKAFFYIALLAFIAGCNSSTSSDKTVPVTNANTSKENQSATPGTKEDGIVGEWELSAVISDENGNDAIDENERAKAMTQMKDYMKLNSDGSAQFYTFKTEGRYEIRTNESGDRKYLDLYDKANMQIKKGYILSLTKDEMILMKKFGGNNIMVWKRI